MKNFKKQIKEALTPDFLKEGFKDYLGYSDTSEETFKVGDEVTSEKAKIYDGVIRRVKETDRGTEYEIVWNDGNNLIQLPAGHLDKGESLNEEDKKWSSYEQRMVNQIKAAQKEKRGMYTLPMKTQDFYRKNKDKFENLEENHDCEAAHPDQSHEEWEHEHVKNLLKRNFEESVNEDIVDDKAKYRVEYTTQDGEKAKSRVYNSEEEADKKEADLVNSGIKQAKVVKVEESINEDIVDDKAKIYWLQKLKKGEIDTLPDNPRMEYLRQAMRDQVAHDKEQLRRERGLEESINEMHDSQLPSVEQWEDAKLKKIELISEMDLDRSFADVFGKGEAERRMRKQVGGVNDPVLMKARAAKTRHEKEAEEERMRDRRWGKTDRERQQHRWGLQDELDDLKDQQKQMYIDMEQEAEPEGGEIADMYGSDLNDIEAKIDIITAELEEMGLYESNSETEKEIKSLEDENPEGFETEINLLKTKLKEDNSYIRVSEPRFRKDKNNPNFLYGYMDYDTGPGGASIALGKETMSGQIRRESSQEALAQMEIIGKKLEDNYDLEDLEIVDLENGKVKLFAVSDDFEDIDIRSELSMALLNEEFKVGDKVTYLGHPAVVTATKEYNGRDFVSVSYDKGTGKTKASDILVKSGTVKAVDEGTCGYTPDGKPRSKPAGPVDEESDTDVGGGAKQAIGLDIDDEGASDAALDDEVNKMGYNESKEFNFKKMIKEALTPDYLK